MYQSNVLNRQASPVRHSVSDRPSAEFNYHFMLLNC